MQKVKVHFIAGKGGVGKTLVSQALASLYAAQKKRTLLVSLSEEESKEKKASPSVIEENIRPYYSTLRIFPDLALYEYLSMKLPGKKMLDSFMAQNLFRALTSAMPGLSDLTRLGKIWFHADDNQENTHKIYEKIVVDMPSSGFVGRFLSIAKIVYEVVKIGPLAKEAKLIYDYFKNPNNARLHVVTLPEELVVNETIELFLDVKNRDNVKLGMLFVNRVLFEHHKNSDVLENVANFPHLYRIVNYFSARREDEQQQQLRLQKNIDMPLLPLTDCVGETLNQNIIEQITKQIAAGFKQ